VRRAARQDSNQRSVVDEARACGASVMLHPNGKDEPDLVIGWSGVTCLVEVKPAGKAYTPDAREKARAARQRDYLANWQGGPAFIASSWVDVLAAILRYREEMRAETAANRANIAEPRDVGRTARPLTTTHAQRRRGGNGC
jgi:hypothetical protein